MRASRQARERGRWSFPHDAKHHRQPHPRQPSFAPSSDSFLLPRRRAWRWPPALPWPRCWPASLGARAQATTAPAQADAQTTPPAQTTATPKPDIALSNQKPAKTRKAKEEKVVVSKDTKKEDKKVKKDNPLVGMDAKLPDKALYDKAEDAIKHGRFDVGRLDLQTLLNTYPDSQFMMRAKLAIADSWYKEGGTAALTQAEQEYKDFITFFPNAPEAAEAQMRVGDIYFRQMDKPDRDYTNTRTPRKSTG